MRRIVRAVAAVTVVFAALAPRGRAQDEEEPAPRPPAPPIAVEAGREAAWKFLTQGEGAPCPQITREQLARAEVSEGSGYARLGGTPLELRIPGCCSVAVAPDGTVIDFDQAGGSGLGGIRGLDERGQPRPKEDREREFRERSRFDVPALREGALAFLRSRYPDFAERRWEEGREPRTDLTFLRTSFVFSEQRKEGQLAVYPNFISIELCHETGVVVMYRVTNIRGVLTDPPAVTREQVDAHLAETFPGVEVALVELALILKQGRPTAVWHCVLRHEGQPYRFLYDAQTFAPHTTRED